MPIPKFTDVELAEQANSAHREVITAQLTAIHAARRAGDALIAAKRIVVRASEGKKGAWTPWLEANFSASVQTARVYIRVAKDWPKLEPHVSPSSGLSLAEALRILKVEPEAHSKRRDTAKTCREALVASFRDFVNTELSEDEVIFLTGSGNFIVERLSQFYFEFLERVREEIRPIAGRYVAAHEKRREAVRDLLKRGSYTEEAERAIKECTREIALAFRNDHLTCYQKSVIFSELQGAKSAIPRHLLRHYWLSAEERDASRRAVRLPRAVRGLPRVSPVIPVCPEADSCNYAR